jgi:glycosyltransferase involved in cell wall biosynthesis
VLTVSEYVAERQRSVNLTPRRRVRRLWNGLPLPAPTDTAPSIRASLGIGNDRPLIVSCSRAAPEKGVEYLLRAFDQVVTRQQDGARRPLLVYVGDGPHRPALETLRASLPSQADIVFAGYRADAREYIRAADICVVPSLWQDALPLGVLEPMALAKPVIATRVGGIPEMLRDGIEGMLVPPGEVEPLAKALSALLGDTTRAMRLGEQGRARVAEHFRPETQIAALVDLVRNGFRDTLPAQAWQGEHRAADVY